MDFSNLLVERSIVPEVKIESVNKGVIDIWSYRQRRNLAIIFSHDLSKCDDSRLLLQSVIGNYNNYLENNSEVLWICPTSAEVLSGVTRDNNVPFPMVSNSDNSIAVKFAVDSNNAAVFIVDRFGEVAKKYIAPEEGGLPEQEVLIKYLAYLELRCPECGI